MNIDFTEVINNKLQEMAENRVIEKQIEETVEKTITDAVRSALGSYSFKSKLEKMMSEQVSTIVESIGFTGYNQYIADTLNNIVNNVLKEDIKQKIAGAFDTIFLKKLESVKLSEIVNRYRETLLDSLDDDEKYDHDNVFYAYIDESGDGSFSHITVTLGLEKGYRSDDEYCLELRLMKYKDEDYGVTSVTYGGNDLKELSKIRYISDFEAFAAGLYFNKTKIEVDINERDIDTSLGLDI